MLIVGVGIFLYRIILRKKNFRKLLYIDLSSNDYKEDSKQRSFQIVDSYSLISFIVYGVFLLIELNYGLSDFIAIVIFLTFILYLFLKLASKSILMKSRFYKIVTIFFTSIQGILLITYILAILLNLLLYQTKNHFYNPFTIENIVSFCFVVEESMIVFLLLVIFSIILFVIYIFMTPAYQIEELSDALKISNIIFVVLSIIILYYSNSIIQDINNYKIEVLEKVSMEQYSKEDMKYLRYISEFSKANIINMGYLILLPYTIGILISNFIIEVVKRKFKSKVNDLLKEFLDIDNFDENGTLIIKKKYKYYNGDKFILMLLEKYKNETHNM